MRVSVLSSILLLAAVLSLAGRARAGQDWPSFRGPRAAGVAEGHPLPERWDVEKGEQILWKTAVPGLGYSSPVLVGARLFLTTAVGEGEDEVKVGLYGNVESVEGEGEFAWRVLCLDKKTGGILWERTAHAGRPRFKRHPKSSHANATPAADGSRVVAFFGSEGLYCYDAEGGLLWKKDLGALDWGWYVQPSAQWGGGSSPVIHGGAVILQCDVQKDSFLASFSLQDGSFLWKVRREDVPAWSTPTILEHGGRFQVVVNGYRHMGAYDAGTGEEIWRMSGGGDIPVPTPVAAHGLVFLTSAHGRLSPIYAVRVGARGDITMEEEAADSEFVSWNIRRGGNYMQTPIVYGDLLYACRDNGFLSCFDARTGRRHYRERLGERSEGFTASPVGGDGKLYFASERGNVYVVRAGEEFGLASKNAMGEICMATPALSEGVLYVRGLKHLFAMGR